MHPLLASRAHLWLYLLLWAIAGVVLSAVLVGERAVGWSAALAAAIPLATAFSFVCLSAWYVARGMPLAGGALRVLVTAMSASLVSSALWLVVARAWFLLVARRFGIADASAVFANIQPLLYGFGVLLYLLSLAVSYLAVVFAASQEAERRGLRGQVLAREAELRSLRAQLDPHFLFNSLHSISALTTVDPPAARRMCLLLADFLRQSLALGGEDRITLSQELALIDRFLTIERIRFGDRLGAEISAGGAGACLVPPLLLQPIVENAVTHGIAHVVEGGVIRVTAERTGDVLRVVAENPCDPDRPRRETPGVGLSNVRARLRALHGHDATLITVEGEATWRTELTMPAVEAT
jgi:hypothetical protein